jgi:hypothetical protein
MSSKEKGKPLRESDYSLYFWAEGTTLMSKQLVLQPKVQRRHRGLPNDTTQNFFFLVVLVPLVCSAWLSLLQSKRY